MARKTAARARRVSEESIISDTSARLSVPPAKLRAAIAAARDLSDEEFELVRHLLSLERKGVTRARRQDIALGVTRAIDALAGDLRDPVDAVDEPLAAAEAVQALAQADAEAAAIRAEFLRESVGVEEASRRVGRSRQAIEAMRRGGKTIAFRVRNQWRYPQWQLDADGPGGVLRGLP